MARTENRKSVKRELERALMKNYSRKWKLRTPNSTRFNDSEPANITILDRYPVSVFPKSDNG